jgi:zinc transporter, ZIP family
LSSHLTLILPYILLAAGAGVLGGVLALFWSPGIRTRGAIQHFAAGAVLAAVASNVIPEVERTGTFTGIISGFVLGGLLMIGLKWFTLRFERKEKSKNKLPAGLAAAAALDTFLDGAIISVGFSTGDDQLGTLLVIALALELLFLTLSVGVELRKGQFKPLQTLAVTSGIAFLLLVGAFSASLLFGEASEATLAVVLAFGAAALIYLIAEELLVENVQAEESIFSTVMLFSGFLVLLALKLLG